VKVLSAILVVLACCLHIWSAQVCAEPADVVTGQAENSKADNYWDSVQKQRKFNQCLKLGRGECYKKYQDAVDWCLKNWNECLPMIKRTGVYAGAYGQQVADQCKRELEEKCRAEAGQ